MTLPLLVDDALALDAEPHAAPVIEQLPADARRRRALRADELHVRRRQRRFGFGDAALHVLLRIRPRVALDEVDALDNHAALLGDHPQHASALAAIASRDHDDAVVLLDGVHSSGHRTSGASERLLLNRRWRNSGAT